MDAGNISYIMWCNKEQSVRSYDSIRYLLLGKTSVCLLDSGHRLVRLFFVLVD